MKNKFKNIKIKINIKKSEILNKWQILIAKRDQNPERSKFRYGELLPDIITKSKVVLLY